MTLLFSVYKYYFVSTINIIMIRSYDKWVPVTTEWSILRLRMQ